MHKNNFILLFILVTLLPAWAYAQPDWIRKTPEGYTNDFFVGRGSSKTSQTEAVQFALEDAIGLIIKNGNIQVQSSENFSNSTTEKISNGNSVSLDQVSRIAREITIAGTSKTISSLKEVETYTEQNGSLFDAFVLVSIPKTEPMPLPGPFAPVWRSMLLPGWGQLYKGQSFKGISFMGLTLAGIAGGFILKQLKEDAVNKAFSSRTQARRDFYNDASKSYNTFSLISFITAGVFYSWSLTDAIISKNENLYVDLEQHSDGRYVIQLALKF